MCVGGSIRSPPSAHSTPGLPPPSAPQGPPPRAPVVASLFFLSFEEGRPHPSSLAHLLVMFLETLPDLLQLQGNSGGRTGWGWPTEVDPSEECCACFSPTV